MLFAAGFSLAPPFRQLFTKKVEPNGFLSSEIGLTLLLICAWSNDRGPMVDTSFLFIKFRSICTLSGAQTFWDTYKGVYRLSGVY